MQVNQDLCELIRLVVKNARDNNIPLGQIQMLINSEYRNSIK